MHIIHQIIQKSDGYPTYHLASVVDEKGTGRIQASERLPHHGFLPREDLATAILETMRNHLTIGKTIQLVSGSEKIKPALAAVVGGGDLPPIA